MEEGAVFRSDIKTYIKRNVQTQTLHIVQQNRQKRGDDTYKGDIRSMVHRYSKSCLKGTPAGPNNLSALDKSPLYRGLFIFA